MASKFRKALGLLRRPRFARAMLVHRVAASVEHLPAIHICAAGTLVDAGANKGQFSLAFRALRPEALIIAFEPLPEAANTYERMFARDHRTHLQRVALASAEGSATFHVADRADSSSLLRPGPGQALAFGVRAAKTIEVPVKRLGDCVDFATLPQPVLLKVDVQGGELAVFDGCTQLDLIDFIYVELSFIELYVGQPLFQDVSGYLAERGFRIIGVFNQVSTREFGPTQADVLFHRERA
ncbi:FkbM family methyltransferase [Mycolicibacterium sp.]|uniref:FkbM family methyltransferase n=1 Tax=Mycolicibacterium sp. TaxID=2320850 RepID=UPI0037C8237F